MRRAATLLTISALSLALTSAPAGGVAGFGDVAGGRFYTSAVQWMVDNEITTGTRPTCFSPREPVTRGQAAAFLWRMEGFPMGSPPHPFGDVVKDWQQDAVSWMFANGITTGTSPSTYAPDEALTRGQLAALLHRLAGLPMGSPPHPFGDVVEDWQQDAVSWMFANGITTGTSPSEFSPDEFVSRGQLAAFLYRYQGSPAVEVDPDSTWCFGPGSATPLVLDTVLSGLAAPTAAGLDPVTGDLYITERAGLVKRVPAGPDGVPDFGSVATVLDVDSGDAVVSGGEQGLLGVAVAPDGEHIYVGYTATGSGASVVVEYPLANGSIDSGGARTIISVGQPEGNHNGGNLVFGPDGYLYTSFGDGGGANDQHGIIGNGQDTTTLLGAILRIDVSATSPGKAYAIPPDNPFVGGSGADEIFLYGVRNPWKFSFDRETGDLWVADVGQGAREEITRLTAASGGGRGANLGWRLREGTIATPGVGGPVPAGHVGPVHEYDQSQGGCSVTGGYVYRGSDIPALDGVYVFSDYCHGDLWGWRGTFGSEAGELGVGVPSGLPSAFAEDANGELYTISLNGTIARLAPGA
jgi:glucose/arabinose dehydrogenase